MRQCIFSVFFQHSSLMEITKKLSLHRLLQKGPKPGCSSARLEYTSGGRVVARSNRAIPTKKG